MRIRKGSSSRNCFKFCIQNEEVVLTKNAAHRVEKTRDLHC